MSCEAKPFRGGTLIVCRRGGKSSPLWCEACFAQGDRRPAEKLCDGVEGERTCDRPMCREHVAESPAPGVDLCAECVKGRAG